MYFTIEFGKKLLKLLKTSKNFIIKKKV